MAGFADLFGGMFGGGGPAPTPGLLDAAGYMDPAQYDRARRSQGMMGLWAGLLQGGGPSLEPRNFGSALGAGLGGMNTFGNQFDESQLHAAQAAQGRANVGKLGAEAENLRASTKMLADAAAMGIGMQAPGAAPVGGGTGTGTGGVPNFGAGTDGAGIAASEHYATAIRLGATPNEAALLTSAAGAESSFNPTAVHDGGIGYGLYGHNADRLAAMRKQFGERPGAAQQIEFALNELRSRPEGARVNVAKTPEELTELQFQFERPKRGPGDQAAARLASTRAYMQNPPTAPAGALGGPVPSAVAGGPAAPVPAPLAGAPSGNRPGTNLPASGSGLVTPQDYEQWLARQRGAPGGSGSGSGPPVPPTDAGGDGAGPQFGYDSARAQSPAPAPAPAIAPSTPFPPAPWYAQQQAEAAARGAAAAAAQATPQVPAAAVAPAPTIPPAPAPAPPPPVAPAPAPAALAPAAAAETLPAPPVPDAALPLPPRPELPQRQPLPAQPALPAAPAPPPMPGAVAVPPLPAAQAPPAGGAQPYSPQAHKAQMIATALSMAGRTVPAFIAEAAGLPLAGQKAALEAAARQPFTLQGQQYGHALAMAKADWEARNATQQKEHAARVDMTRDEFGASIRQQETDYKAGIDFALKEWEGLTAQQQATRAAALGMQAKEYEERLKIASAPEIAGAQQRAQADNTQTTMVIGGRKVPMTVGDANRITRGESPVTVLGPGVLQLGEEYLTDAQKSRAQAGATKSVEYSFKRLEDADTAGGAASRNLQTMGQLAQAAERFKTGATAEMWLDVKRYARDVGLITGDDVPDGELIRQGSTKLAVMGAPRQGAVSNYERGLMATINPQLVNSPEAFGQLIAISARLDQYDMQVARIHNEVAEKNLGVPDYLEANRRIRELGPPISAAERGALERLQTKDAGGGGAAPAAPAAPPGGYPVTTTPTGTIQRIR